MNRTQSYARLILLLLLSLKVRAQDQGSRLRINSDNFSVYHWSTEEGLPQNGVTDMIQDKNGLLWITTLGGLARFDGYQFTYFDKNTIKEFTSSSTLSIYEDNTGKIWITTENELLSYHYDDHSFSRFEFPLEGLYYISSKNDKIYVNSATAIFSFDGKSFNELYRTDPEKNTIRKVFHTEDELVYLENSTLYNLSDRKPFTDGRFYSNGTQFVKALPDRKSLKVMKDGLQPVLSNDKSGKINRYAVFTLRDGTILSSNKDSTFLHTKDAQLIFSGSNNDLEIKNINAALKTNNGEIWIGSGGNGIYMLHPKRFKSISAKNPNIRSTGNLVYLAPDSSVWFEGYGNVLHSTSDLGKTIENHKIDIINCWSMLKDSKGATWITNINLGAKKVGVDWLRYREDSLTREGLPRTYSVYETINHRLLVGTQKGAFEIINDTLVGIEGSEKHGKVYSFYETPKGELFYCAQYGVGVIKGKKAKKSQILQSKRDVRSLYQDADLNFWIGTADDGLFFYDQRSKKTKQIGKGVLPKDVWTILEDKAGFFWMNSNHGVHRVKRKELIDYGRGKIKSIYSIRFGKADGIENPEGNSRTQNKGFFDFDGNLWLSTVAGPIVIDPLSASMSNFKNPIIIESVFIDGARANLNGLIVKPDKSNIRFNFTQANFSTTKHLGFEYTITGIEDDWVVVGNSRMINLTGVSPGQYTLRIRQMGTGVETSIDFVVEAYFYETKLFLIVVSIIGTFLVLTFFFWILRNRRKRLRKIRVMDAQLKTLKIRALQSQMNPHFVFNCLNSIQSLYIIGKQDKANRYMSRFSKLLRTILVQAENERVTIQEEIDLYNSYIPLEALQLNESFEYSIEIDESINTRTTYIPSMISQTFVENAIKHGLKPLQDHKGKLIISISQTKEEIVISIEDNGVGIEKSLEMKKEIEVEYKSMGTTLTRERIELMNMLDELSIRVKIKSLSHEKGKRGTLVELFFPKKLNDENTGNRRYED